MKTFAFCTSLTALAALSGCQAFSGSSPFAARSAATHLDASSYFDQLLTEGRGHLKANRPGAAITSFRRASYDRASAGEAFNGLAIAYDMIGRYDLAERFFGQAMEADPGDARFARNAARFDAMMLARRGGASNTALAFSDLEESSTVAETSIVSAQSATARAGRMQRISAREVLIVPALDRPGSPEAASTPRANARVAIADLQERDISDTTYPVRIALRDIGSEEDGASGRPDGSAFVGPGGKVRIQVSGHLNARPNTQYPVRLVFGES